MAHIPDQQSAQRDLRRAPEGAHAGARQPAAPVPPCEPEPARAPVPTSADVARLAGVSRATVSYVLNNTTAVRISEPTRRRVQEAADELGYVPHAAARSLRAGHSRMVLMPAPSMPVGALYGHFFSELQWALRRLDYTVVQFGSLGMSGDDAARAWAELRPVAVLAPGDGTLTPRGVHVLKRSGAKAVVTVGPQRVEGAHALLMDQRTVGRCAGAHLLDRGRSGIGVVVPREPGFETFSAPRLAGVRAAAEAAAEARPEVRVVPLELAYEEQSAAQLADRWRELGLDAVFAYNDEYAMLLLRALQDAGVDVPGETAVMGADDLLLGRLLRPRLSTVRMELPSGQRLAELVDRVVRDPAGTPEVHPLLTAEAVRRDST